MNEIIQWIKDNSTAIIAGIISSGIVLLLQVFIGSIINSITYLLTNRLTLSRLYGIKDGDSAYIASGEIPVTQPQGNNTTILQGPDSTAANFLVGTLQELYKDSSIRHIYTGASTKIQPIHENIFTVGGPKYNSTTKHFMKYLPDEVDFDQNGILKVFGESFQKDSTNQEDYGLLAKIKSPYMHDKYIYILAGCGTYGVLAASYLISNQRYFPKLKLELAKELGLFNRIKKMEYVAVVKCDTNNNETGKPKLVLVKKISE
ncbi:hypothetical protein [Roseivirga echinicomitans]|uniref:Uncharacterized protein n=1 Tax=Roseivirga echinicomitans TaxID=296218 RepID=A0A150WZP6_9BACT|nr:hypothetical protein [Roseivirga echinicomitans]KYG71961.1 hypothetical protein AWN68_12335 [Roseivirga echinicomitans]